MPNEEPVDDIKQPWQQILKDRDSLGSAKRTGIVQLNGGVFVDDGGPFFATGATLMAGAWAYRHDRDRLIENLDFLHTRGIDYIRVLGTVGPDRGGWEDRTVDPTAAGFEEDIAGLTDLVYDHGMRIEWTIFGGVDRTPARNERERVVRQFAAMSKGREEKILHWEVANEAWQNGFWGQSGRDELRALGALLRAETPILTALSAPWPVWIETGSDGTMEVPYDRDRAEKGEITYYGSWLYGGSQANLFTEHGDRSSKGTGREWRWTRQGWDVQFLSNLPKGWTNNEPKGPQSSVEADDDPLRITMAAALTPVFGGAAFVYHTGAGVRFGGAADLAKGRVANFSEVAHIESTLSGFRSIKRILPGDLGNWRRANIDTGKFPNAPFEFQPLLDAQEHHGTLLRAFSASSGNRFVSMPIAIAGPIPFIARSAMTVEVVDPMSSDILKTVELNAGDDVGVDGSRPALILRGTWR